MVATKILQMHLDVGYDLGISKEYKLLTSGIDDPDEYFEELKKI